METWQALWTPLFAFVMFGVIFTIGDTVSNLTKGILSTIVVGCMLYLVGFWTGVIPKTLGDGAFDAITITHFPQMMSSFGIALMITNLGTMIHLEHFVKEWKTVLVGLFGLVGLALGTFTVGTWLFGRWFSLAASSPIAGGIIAGIITNEAAVKAGHPEIGGFALLMTGFDMFLGMPISSYLLRREATHILKSGKIGSIIEESKAPRKINIQLIKRWPDAMQSDTFYIVKLAIAALIGVWAANQTYIPLSSGRTFQVLNPAVAYLIFGIIFTEIGFLDRQALSKCGAMSMLMLGTIAILPAGMKAISPAAFLKMIYPIFGTVILAIIMIGIFSVILGKLLGYSPEISVCIGLTSMVAYPGTQIITEEVIKGLDCSPEEKEALTGLLLPKMLVGGFTTVTIASVIFAGIVAPLIFL